VHPSGTALIEGVCASIFETTTVPLPRNGSTVSRSFNASICSTIGAIR
jgi:hypothetical protein